MHYRDNRPLGLNNLNGLVDNHFNPDSFAVVQQVHFNLRWLKSLYDNLPLLNTLGSNTLHLENLSSYIGDIHNISHNLRELVELNDHIPLLKDIAPRVCEFADKLKGIENQLISQELQFKEVLGLMESNTKHLEDLYCQYESSLSYLISNAKREISELTTESKNTLSCLVQQAENLHNDLLTAMPFVNEAVKNQQANKLLLEHLKASDLVTIALFTGLDEDSNKALKQIKESEKYGNDESVNRKRLNYKVSDNNVLNVLKQNQERLTKEKEND